MPINNNVRALGLIAVMRWKNTYPVVDIKRITGKFLKKVLYNGKVMM
jgi:3-deoxy-D-arabino-heptulosonate 7-phosphate (DAHP) synthase class II